MQFDNYLVVSSQYPQLSPQCYEIARCTAEKIDLNNPTDYPTHLFFCTGLGGTRGFSGVCGEESGPT